MVKLPLPSVVALRIAPVSVEVIVTLAPEITAPLESVTVPPSEPFSNCAKALTASRANSVTATAKMPLLFFRRSQVRDLTPHRSCNRMYILHGLSPFRRLSPSRAHGSGQYEVK